MVKKIIDKYPLYASAFIFGVLGAINSFLLFFFFYGMGIYPFSDYHFIEFLLVALFIVLGMWYYRDLQLTRVYHFWQGLAAGFLTNLTISIVYGIFMYLFLTFAQPEFFKVHVKTMSDKWLADKKVLLAAPNMDLKRFNETLHAIAQTTPADIALDEFIKKGMFGSVIFFAASILLRRNEYDISIVNPHSVNRK